MPAASVRRAALSICAVLVPVTAASAWDALPVEDDPLVRMPGTQPADGVSLEGPSGCITCHSDYDPTVQPGSHWQGSMMGQANRDPIYWATLVVAAQDSIWLLGRPNATDICIRCHSPSGWVGHRSDPTNGSMLTGADFDGVHCEGCHRAYDPFFEATHDGTRDGSDWAGYWDETDASRTPSSAAAAVTLTADRTESEGVTLFNGGAFFDATTHEPPATWTENAGGQYFFAMSNERRGPFADADSSHVNLYSRYTKSRYFCSTCHDVSNPVLANLSFAATTPGDGTTVLPTETDAAHSYGHVERTFSEFMLSDYAVGSGAEGLGPYAPSVFGTSRPGNRIASCQDCHLPDAVGAGARIPGAVLRPDRSVEHPKSGQPVHDLQGGNAWVPWLLASAVPGSPNHDPVNEALLDRGPAALTLDLDQGLPLDPAALLAGAERARDNLARAAAIEALTYDATTGEVEFRIQNHTGHKLPSGYPEGRRMFVNIRVWDAGSLVWEVNPYDPAADTLRGLDPAHAPSSPALGASESHEDELVYEALSSASALAGDHTFHFALADGRYKDNRIPPLGFRIAEAESRLVRPVYAGVADTGLFQADEYAGGYDEVSVTVPTGADGVEVTLFYQTTSREYVEFLRDEIAGTATTLTSPTPSGETEAYVAQTDPWFSALAQWGEVIWDLWSHNADVPGAAPVRMARATTGTLGDPCAIAGSDGVACDDGDACTRTDLCSGGACVGSDPVTCAPIDQCHGAGSCDSATGACSTPALADGTACDDRDECSRTDTCVGGVCTGSDVRECTPPGECVDSWCAASAGSCRTSDLPDGTACTGGTCSAGECVVVDGGVDAGAPDGGASDAGAADGGSVDAGSAPMDSGTAGDAAVAVDAGPTGDGDDGCGCSAPGSSTASGRAPALLVLGFLLWGIGRVSRRRTEPPRSRRRRAWRRRRRP